MGDVKQIVIVSDMHCGCQLGLCPPVVKLDGGGQYIYSDFQREVWDYWCEFWGTWVPKVTRGEPYGIVLNGDPIDGLHHGVTTLISSNIEDQLKIAYECMRPHVDKASVFYAIRGTEVHGGQAGKDEEALAARLGAEPDKVGRHARWELRIKIDKYLVDIQHHIATVGSAAYETTALQRLYVSACEEAGRWQEKAPDVIVRSHRHRSAETKVPSASGSGIVVTTPGWQLKTPLTFRMQGAQMSVPQFGGILIRAGDEEVYVRSQTWSIPRSEVEIL